MIRYLILLLLLTGCIHMTPVQSELWMGATGEPEEVWISSEELIEILPSFASVEPGVYKLTPNGMVSKLHDAPWCMAGSSRLFKPMGWDCKDYSHDVLRAFEDDFYAVGVAWSDDHMVFAFINMDMEVGIYEPETCQFNLIEARGLCIGPGCLNDAYGVRP